MKFTIAWGRASRGAARRGGRPRGPVAARRRRALRRRGARAGVRGPVATCGTNRPPTRAFNRPSVGRVFHEFIFCFYSQTFWETSTQENLALEASDRPETRLELLTRLSSIRFFFHFLISSRIKQGTQLIMNPSDNDYRVV